MNNIRSISKLTSTSSFTFNRSVANLAPADIVPPLEKGSDAHRNLGFKTLIKPAPGRSRPIYRTSPKFSQAIQLSDGSSFFVKSTSPRWLVALTKDTRNMVMWNPRLRNLRRDSGPVLDFKTKFGDLDSFGLEEFSPELKAAEQVKRVKTVAAPEPTKGKKKGK